ncbi:MAG: fused MFS/spermidine synthase [Candidatus Hydrogenedentes bacterium]|nr:fused MFS/spermidine synthase [Candidatus Hydrogenedentota bacterium]
MSEPKSALAESNVPTWPISVCIGLVAFTAGGAVMIYEFVAVRYLQRSFGSLLDVWACEIAVCMAGLAIGYTLGGVLADRFRSWRVLGGVLILAALSALPMEPLAVGMGEWMLDREAAWWHPLAAATSSFLPLLALGTVMPQAVRLYVRRFERVGTATGWIATISTTGSIIGVLLTAMALFPRLGVVESCWATSAVLALMGGTIVIVSSIRRWRGLAIVAFILALNACIPAAAAEVLFEKYSAYHHILVVDRGDQRMLQFDTSRQSVMSKSDPYTGGFEYTQFFHTALLFNPAIRSVLFVGLGGGTGPKSFFRGYPAVQIEVAEIDPMVVSVAKEYFALPDHPRIATHVSDGRTHLRRSKEQYGAIFMDAYGVGRYAGCIPFHLATREFFQIARERLVNGGCLVYNIMGIAKGANAETVCGIHATLDDVFDAVYAFQAASSQNTVLVAQKIDPGAPSAAAWPNGPCLENPLDAERLSEMAATLVEQGLIAQPNLPERVKQLSPLNGAPPSGIVFTDNYAPVDVTPGLRRVE